MQPQYPPQYPNVPPPPMPSANSRKHLNGLLIPLIVILLLLLVAICFGLWAFSSQQDYKNNSDKKAAAAVQIAKQEVATSKDKEFVEKEKSPYKTYTGPANYGSVGITYPKTWSAYLNETSNGAQPVDGYWHPDVVPGLQSGTALALRMQVVNQAYDQVMKTFEGNTKVGKVKVSPYKAEKVPQILGSRVDGEVNPGQKDSMVVFPLRDKTLKVWTESDRFLNDFNTIILPNLTFVP